MVRIPSYVVRVLVALRTNLELQTGVQPALQLASGTSVRAPINRCTGIYGSLPYIYTGRFDTRVVL